MAYVEFIGQRLLGSSTTADKVMECFSLEHLINAVMCVAFARFDGVETIFRCLCGIDNRMKVIVGINNGITSAQALARILEAGVELYVVNTGNSVTFHPKVYYGRNATSVRAIVGSSNLTNAGLNSNIEFSSYSVLTLTLPEDQRAFEQLNGYVEALLAAYPPACVFKIENTDNIHELLNAYLLENESVMRNVPPILFPQSPPESSTITMMLPTIRSYSHANPIFSSFPPAPIPMHNAFAAPQNAGSLNYVLIWESGDLTKRDLNIPTGVNTNPTGSMGLKKGNWAVDQRSYFRENVFQSLTWQPFTARSNVQQEEAWANFQIRVQGICRGTFTLRITHDPRTDTPSYRQSNMMTHLHWGEAISVIANRDLLSRIMRLYRNEANRTEFIIEIN